MTEHVIDLKPNGVSYFRGVSLIPPLCCPDPESWIAERIYQMGADQELEACCELLGNGSQAAELRAARRPKPPSLKQQGLDALRALPCQSGALEAQSRNTIRLALEALPDD